MKHIKKQGSAANSLKSAPMTVARKETEISRQVCPELNSLPIWASASYVRASVEAQLSCEVLSLPSMQHL